MGTTRSTCEVRYSREKTLLPQKVAISDRTHSSVNGLASLLHDQCRCHPMGRTYRTARIGKRDIADHGTRRKRRRHRAVRGTCTPRRSTIIGLSRVHFISVLLSSMDSDRSIPLRSLLRPLSTPLLRCRRLQTIRPSWWRVFERV